MVDLRNLGLQFPTTDQIVYTAHQQAAVAAVRDVLTLVLAREVCGDERRDSASLIGGEHPALQSRVIDDNLNLQIESDIDNNHQTSQGIFTTSTQLLTGLGIWSGSSRLG